MTKKHLKDPVLKIHRDLLAVEKKACRSVSPRRKCLRSPKPIRRKASKTRSKAATRFKWAEVVKKTKIEKKNRDYEKEEAESLASDGPSTREEKTINGGMGKEEEQIMEDLSDLNKALEDYEETVIANLIYDEVNDDIRTMNHSSDEGAGNGGEKDPSSAETAKETDEVSAESSSSSKKTKHLATVNPMRSAFESAQGVDDLFRIAEIWVNPSDYDVG